LDARVLAAYKPAQLRRARVAAVIVVNRFRVPDGEQAAFREDLERARETLAVQRGYQRGAVGRNVDDPELWLLTTEWEGPGAYRRALSAYDVKLTAVPVLSRALDEPGAYEAVVPGEPLNVGAARGSQEGVPRRPEGAR
jgi:quinol monooxygenase YgiN